MLHYQGHFFFFIYKKQRKKNTAQQGSQQIKTWLIQRVYPSLLFMCLRACPLVIVPSLLPPSLFPVSLSFSLIRACCSYVEQTSPIVTRVFSLHFVLCTDPVPGRK